MRIVLNTLAWALMIGAAIALVAIVSDGRPEDALPYDGDKNVIDFVRGAAPVTALPMVVAWVLGKVANRMTTPGLASLTTRAAVIGTLGALLVLFLRPFVG